MQPVASPHGYVSRLVCMQVEQIDVARDARRTGQYDPVLAAVLLHLQGKRCTRLDDDPLDLESLAFRKHSKTTPWPMHCPVL